MIPPDKLSPICFGCEPLGGTDWGDVNIHDIEAAIYYALDLGVNFFDTAAVYGLGLSEERLSKILGYRRHDVIIATKGGLSWETSDSSHRFVVTRDSSPLAIRADIENSLRRLKLDCLPVFFIHWPDLETPIDLTFETLMMLVDEGKIGKIGCSNFSVQQVKIACSVSNVDYLQIPLNILSLPVAADLSAICVQYDIRIIAYNVLANGLLTGKFDKETEFLPNDRRSRLPLFQGNQYLKALSHIEELKQNLENSTLTLAQHSIQWALGQSNISSIILGIKNIQQIEENWSAITTLS